MRLFVAIRPPEPVRDVLLDTMGGVQSARWQDDDQLHLTLAFLGEVDPRDGDALVDQLETVSRAPFELAIDGVGHFERKGVPSVLWARIAPSERLASLQSRVALACRKAGTPAESRKFSAHVTLARLGRTAGPVAGWLAAHAGLSAGPWRVEEFALYESRLRPEGSIYRPLVSFPLRP